MLLHILSHRLLNGQSYSSGLVCWENPGRWKTTEKMHRVDHISMKIELERALEVRPEHKNHYQMEDSEAAHSAPPQGGLLFIFHLVRVSKVLS